MAIQLRRGDYEDFEKTKMQGGELAVVTSNDPNTESGCATYVSYASGDESKVKRLLQEGEIEKTLEELGIEALPIASSSDVWQGTDALVPMYLLEAMLGGSEIMQHLARATNQEYGIMRFAGGAETALGEENLAATPSELKYILAETGSWADEQMSDESKGIVQNKVIKQYVDNICKSKATVFCLKGNNEPTTNANEYPDVELGDFCVNEGYRAWICEYLHKDSNTVVWSEILTPTSPYLSSYYYTKSLIDNKLEAKADKNEWELFNTYEADGKTGGFEHTQASGIKAKEIMVIGRGLTFSAGANINLGFRTSENPYSTGHQQLVFGNAVGTGVTYQFQGTIQRVGTNEILVTIELWAEKSVATSNVLKRQHLFKNAELFENKNIVHLSTTLSSGTSINTGTIETYVKGVF